ncbi:transposase [Streptomyces sp. NPDC052114]|uniref:IS701 family transposase n=1 Tax=unclassified Streptomyces TaxID=2593676 RepID=UPI003422FA91
MFVQQEIRRPVSAPTMANARASASISAPAALAASAALAAPAGPTASTPASAPAFADELFRRLPRADQRRWAQAYVQALLVTPGKKTMRRLAASVSDSPTASQALHQFVNASPWLWSEVREDLIWQVSRYERPRAWTVAPVVLPKRGTKSCGVHRRFAPERGRSVSCQLALGAFLSTAAGEIPVDWSLHLPGPWLDDPVLRSRARIPESVTARSVAAGVLSLVDNLTVRSPQRPLPVVADIAGHGDPGELVHGLSARGREFVVAVPASLPLVPDGPPRGPRRTEPVPVPALHAERLLRTQGKAAGGGRLGSAWVRLAGERTADPRPYRLFTDPRPGPGTPRGGQLWITNMVHRPTEDLLRLIGAQTATAETLHSLTDDFGLYDFEGRSFPGWHHHMTLVSGAFAYRALMTDHARSPALRSA